MFILAFIIQKCSNANIIGIERFVRSILVIFQGDSPASSSSSQASKKQHQPQPPHREQPPPTPATRNGGPSRSGTLKRVAFKDEQTVHEDDGASSSTRYKNIHVWTPGPWILLTLVLRIWCSIYIQFFYLYGQWIASIFMVNGVQGVLDYRDLNYRNFTIPGSIKYSIYGSNSSIIGISILEIVVPKLPGFRLSGNFFGPSHPDNRGLPVVLGTYRKREIGKGGVWTNAL